MYLQHFRFVFHFRSYNYYLMFVFVSVFRGQENVKGTPRKHSLAFLNVGVFKTLVLCYYEEL